MYVSSPEPAGPRYFTAGASEDEKATGLVGDTTEPGEDNSPGCTKWRVCAPCGSGLIIMRICSPLKDGAVKQDGADAASEKIIWLAKMTWPFILVDRVKTYGLLVPQCHC